MTTFADQPSEMRMIYRGKMMVPEFTLGDYMLPGTKVMKIHLVLQLRGGGPPQGNREKPDAHVKARNEVAKALLEVGCDLQETTATVNALVKRTGLTPINGALRKREPAARIAALQELAKTVGVELPNFNHAAMNRQQVVQQKLMRNQTQSQAVMASQCALKQGHFRNQDDTPCSILKTISNGASGIVIADLDTALPWLEKQCQVSQDELAIFILGGCQASQSGKCPLICVPAYNEQNSPVVLSGCLHDLGAKKVKVEQPQGAEVIVPESVVCAVTVHKDEIDDSQWNLLCAQPVRQIVELLEATGNQVEILGSPWGKSWWGELGKTVPQSALSLQMHMRVSKAKLRDLLRISGMAGAYVNPKNDRGGIDTTYAIVWSEQTLLDLRVTATTIDKALGLVRITRSQLKKTSRGIRVHADDYETCFKMVKPSIYTGTQACTSAARGKTCPHACGCIVGRAERVD